VISVSFSPDGLRIISASDDGIKIWNLETGKVEKNYSDGGTEFYSAVFSQDGKRFAIGSNKYKVYIWNSEAYKIEKCL
jgi:WD40 repeat protein